MTLDLRRWRRDITPTDLTIADFFAGIGGTSWGATMAGLNVAIAANHWKLAVTNHALNHPKTEHIVADLSQYDPRYFPHTDLGWFSPECTTHSLARGHKYITGPDLFGETLPDEAIERSRVTMWDVVRFAEFHQYQLVFVENVIEVRRWAPYRAWLQAMFDLGYDHREISLNSMHAQAYGDPAPQSRDRLYVMFWRRGSRVPDIDSILRPPAWCMRCEALVESRQLFKAGRHVGKYRQQYTYICTACATTVEPAWIPAAAAIDWTLRGQRIGGRSKPLADKTRARIAAGIRRYWGPLVIEAAGNTYDAADPRHPAHGSLSGYYRAWPTSDALRTLHATNSKALLVPVEGRDGKQAQTAEDALRTMTTRNETGIALPALIAELRGGGSTARPAADPLATVAAGGNHHALVMPYYTHGIASTDSDPVGTITTRDRFALVMRNNTARAGDGAEMSTPVTQPYRTMTTSGNQSLITADYADAMVDDCEFRMLEPHEQAAAMAFPRDMRWEGTKRAKYRMAGNAVTPPTARDIIRCGVESLGEA